MERPPLKLPQELARLPDMALGRPSAFPAGAPSSAAKARRWRDGIFEHAVWDSLEAAGLHVRRLGHHKPGSAVPDAVAAFPRHPGFLLLVDAKLSSSAYGLPRSDCRALADYAKTWARRVHKRGRDQYEKLFILVVSSTFKSGLGSKVAYIKRESEVSLLADVLLVPAKALAELVLVSMHDARLDSAFYDELFSDCPSPLRSARIHAARDEAIQSEADFPEI